MAKPCIPSYVSQDFSACPPGHRFTLYFDLWSSEQEEYRLELAEWAANGRRGREPQQPLTREDWIIPSKRKTEAAQRACVLPDGSRAALKALCERQRTLAASVGVTMFAHPARLTAPLATGLGNEHPLENGFAFLSPHGLPYLAGSGLKGVIRRAAEELASGEWGDSAGWNKDAIDILFGLETESGDTEATRTRGALMFWDLFFRPASDKAPLLAVEIMTPHHSGYLQGNGTPHANEQPNPIPFLAVAAGCECTLYVQCNPAQISADAGAMRTDWPTLLAAAVEHAGEWMGFGAKSAVGYGRIGQDQALSRKLKQEAAERAEKQAREAREAELATLSPQARTIAEFVERCRDKQGSGRKDQYNPGGGLFSTALQLSKQALDEARQWSGADRIRLADALTEWLPKVIEKLDRKDDWKDARKRLCIAALRGE
ncbi:type III-B CRISPR module RAMP protein Cmr6 [Thauera sp. JM12B12]|uniref:type III-B CRISPR module RAMP protein Cmr6 n=1 Tax=Thauera sp. JM12B12 TaxID=3142262 RepID=UPI0031F413B2